MPAQLDDPTAPTIYRVSGNGPPDHPGQALPVSIQPRQVTLRDRTTIATLMPIGPGDHIPPRLLAFICELLNNEIRLGDTYPMLHELPVDAFRAYWFQNFGAIMLTGEVLRVEDLTRMENSGVDWKELCMGSFYIKPNYPGRSSHVCNAGFLVSNASRNRGVGKLMGEGYLDWAPKLGYLYSVFNLVYETNTASIRIWDSLGFKRIGRVKGCGSLRSHPGGFVDAIIYGRDLGNDSEDLVSEERFDKIRYYLKHQKYPVGADRAEKSRLRSAATHYHLEPGNPGEEEKLMLKDKEVISDQNKQYEIAKQIHSQSHGGINKTTASIAESYHWVRIKETVSLVIKNCQDCTKDSRENPKLPAPIPAKDVPSAGIAPSRSPPKIDSTGTGPADAVEALPVSSAPRPQTIPMKFEQPLAPSLSGTPKLSRDASMTRQSPIGQQTPVTASPSMTLPPQAVMNARPLQPAPHQRPPHPHTMQMPQQSQLQSHIPHNIIPPHINNHLGMAMTSAHVTPVGSTVHSPLPNGPASAPLSNMQQPFDMHQLDPMLQMQQYTPQEMSAQSIDDAMQGLGHLDMDTSMQELGDLNAMGLGDPSVHGMTDHGSLGQPGHPGHPVHSGHPGHQGHPGHPGHQGHQGHPGHPGHPGHAAGPMGLGPLPGQHPGGPDGMMNHHNHHAHAIKHEMPDFNADTIMLDINQDLSRPANSG